MTQHMIEQAKAVMRKNDRGSYTVPTQGLYPFQWNWDSALSALGAGCWRRDPRSRDRSLG